MIMLRQLASCVTFTTSTKCSTLLAKQNVTNRINNGRHSRVLYSSFLCTYSVCIHPVQISNPPLHHVTNQDSIILTRSCKRSTIVVNRSGMQRRRWFCTHVDSGVNGSNHVHIQPSVGITKSEQRNLIRKQPCQPTNPHILKVAVIGPPNAGKSTLANQLIGWRFSSVSNKVHTTRKKAVGVLTEGSSQVIFLDTPGLITSDKMKKHNLEKTLLQDPYSTLFEADLIVAVIDVSKVWNRVRLDHDLLTALALHRGKRAILVLNKVDLVRVKSDLLTSTRILTAGYVGGKPIKCQQTTKQNTSNDPSYDQMIQKMDQKTVLCESNSANSRHNSVNKDISFEDIQFDTSSEQLELHHINDSMDYNASEQIQSDDLDDDNPEILETDSDCQKASVADETWWHTYHREVKKARKIIADQTGWEYFDEVFMVSAIDGDGVEDLKDYLLTSCQPGPWEYNSSVVTDQDPIEMAKMCIREKLLDHLPREIPYQLQVSVSMWQRDEEGTLRAVFDVISPTKRHSRYLLMNKAAVLRRVSMEAKQDLLNTFRQDMTLKLIVRTQPKSTPR